MPLAHVPGAVHPARLLVGADESAARPPAFPGQGLERHRLRSGEVEHVEGAAPPHLAVHELASEGIARPVLGGHRHHVGVPHEAEGGRSGIRALDARDQALAPGSALGLVDLDVEPALAEVGSDEIAVAHLLAGFHGAVVHARVADHLLQELHRLVGEGVVHGGRHHSIVWG